MDPECKKRIMSEDFADFMVKYGEALEDISAKLDVCRNQHCCRYG